MGIKSFVIDPDAAEPLTGDEIIAKINTDTTDDITRASSVSAAARPIEALEVDTAELAAGAVEEAKLDTGAVTVSKIGAGAVEEAKIAAGAVATAKLADSAVTGARVRASEILTLTDQPLDTETVVLDSKTYTFQDVLTDVDGNVKIGTTFALSIANLVSAINLNGVAGTDYAAAMTIHPTVQATGDATTVDVEAKDAGTAGNSIASTETLTNGSFGSTALSGGTDSKLAGRAANDDLDGVAYASRKYVKTNPATGEFRIIGIQREADGDLDVEYDDQAAT